MRIIDEWTEIPAGRRHTYFYLCLLLGALAAWSIRQPAPAPAFASQIDPLVKVIRLQDAPPPALDGLPDRF
jgi:hypothetical protein